MSYPTEERKSSGMETGNIGNREAKYETSQRAENFQSAEEARRATLQRVETFKDTASTIREYAIMARETSKALRESGAIPELVVAVREIASVTRHIAAEVKETSRELKESGVTNEIATTVRDTMDATKDTAQVVEDAANSTKKEVQIEQKTSSFNRKQGSMPAGVK